MAPISNIKSDRSGFSLIELIITIAIMGIVMGIATLNFQAWQKKNNMEAQLRQIYVDLNEARTNAFTQKKSYRIIFQPSSYVMKSYSTENEPKSSGRTIANKTLKYGLTSKNTTGTSLAVDITDRFVEFNSRGFTSNLFTVIMNPLTADSVLNCLVIYETRINLGKINGTACEFK